MTRYVAAKRLKVGDEIRQPGDAVPEAAGWRNRKAYVAGGYLAEVPDVEDAPDMERVEKLEEETASLREELDALRAQLAGEVAGPDTDSTAKAGAPADGGSGNDGDAGDAKPSADGDAGGKSKGKGK